MRMRVEKAHAAGFGDEMRRLRESDGVQSPADAVAGFEQTNAQMRPVSRQPPSGINAGNTAADDGDIELGRRRPGQARRECQGSRAAKDLAAAEAHGAGAFSTSSRAR
jgi:hypothetical protein